VAEDMTRCRQFCKGLRIGDLPTDSLRSHVNTTAELINRLPARLLPFTWSGQANLGAASILTNFSDRPAV
jgi:hypothetical protein